MKLTDGKKTVEIKMYGVNGIEWSLDFFEAGGLPYDELNDTYYVHDVDYCIDQAKDWESGIGDFSGDEPDPSNYVSVEDLDNDPPFVVLPEYWDQWSGGRFEKEEDAVVTFAEICRLSKEWEIPIRDLMNQVVEQ